MSNEFSRWYNKESVENVSRLNSETISLTISWISHKPHNLLKIIANSIDLPFPLPFSTLDSCMMSQLSRCNNYDLTSELMTIKWKAGRRRSMINSIQCSRPMNRIKLQRIIRFKNSRGLIPIRYWEILKRLNISGLPMHSISYRIIMLNHTLLSKVKFCPQLSKEQVTHISSSLQEVSSSNKSTYNQEYQAPRSQFLRHQTYAQQYL